MILIPSAEKLLANSRTPKHSARAQQCFWGKIRQTSALAAEEKELLQDELSTLRKQLADVVGMSNEKLYQQQYDELQKQLAELKPYKFFKRAEVNEQLKEVEKKLSQIKTQVETATAKIQPQIDAVEARIAEIEC